MRMNFKKIAMVSSVAAMAAASSLTAFAASGWMKDGNVWRYYTRSDEYVTDSFRKSGENYFYLNDDGEMETDALIEHDDHKYAVDVNGAMMVNRWAKFADDDGEENWYYFGANGKAKEDGFATINGGKYHFTDSKMDTGWYDDNSSTYYFNEEPGSTEGKAMVGWLNYDGGSDDVDKEEGWYYFDTNGKLVKDKEKKINGYYYVFDKEGLMLDMWVNFENATPSNLSYDKYYEEGFGNRKDGWVRIDSYEDEDSGITYDDGWYYLKSGRPYSTSYKTTVIDSGVGFAKIGGKTYAFDDKGKMLYGTVEADGHIFYFGTENDGAMKTGQVKIEESDTYDGETMYFNKSGGMGVKGASVTGIYSNKLYNNGVLVEGNSKYEIVNVGGLDYLVKENGSVVTKGTVKDSDAGIKYTVTKNADGGYTITSENI